MDKGIYQDELEMANHEKAIKRLCKEHPGQDDFIRENYLELLRPLSSRATIRTYLTIFVTREVKALISKQKH